MKQILLERILQNLSMQWLSHIKSMNVFFFNCPASVEYDFKYKKMKCFTINNENVVKIMLE